MRKLTADERKRALRIARMHRDRRLVIRAQIILLADNGWQPQYIEKVTRAESAEVAEVVQRLEEGGFGAALRETEI